MCELWTKSEVRHTKLHVLFFAAVGWFDSAGGGQQLDTHQCSGAACPTMLDPVDESPVMLLPQATVPWAVTLVCAAAPVCNHRPHPSETARSQEMGL